MDAVADLFGLIGTQLHERYRVDGVVGEGGFGVVYRGWHLAFDHAVAIKCLKIPPHFTQAAQQVFLENFRAEGRLLSALAAQHLSIVRVYDFGIAEGRGGHPIPFLVLEWLVGRDLEVVLEDRAQRGSPPYLEREALVLLRPAVEAIACAHAATPAIAHRDLKPPNLFLVGDGFHARLKVLDFGIARAMQDGESASQAFARSATGFTAFSPRYGAPEQFHPGKTGYGITGPWTDVHALGLILVELVTGRRALDGETLFELTTSGLAEPRPTPRVRGAGANVSDGFEALCRQALALKSNERFAHAGALLRAMDQLLVEPRAPVPRPRPKPSPLPAPPIEPPTPPSPRRTRKLPLWADVTLATLLVIAAATLYVRIYARFSRSDAPAPVENKKFELDAGVPGIQNHTVRDRFTRLLWRNPSANNVWRCLIGRG